MHTPLRSIVMFSVAALLGAVGQYLYKEGARLPMPHAAAWLTNWRIGAGIVCYVAVMVLFVAAFKAGGQLTVLYPLYAGTFIWALLIGRLFLGENITLSKIAGVGAIIVGMVLIAR